MVSSENSFHDAHMDPKKEEINEHTKNEQKTKEIYIAKLEIPRYFL